MRSSESDSEAMLVRGPGWGWALVKVSVGLQGRRLFEVGAYSKLGTSCACLSKYNTRFYSAYRDGVIGRVNSARVSPKEVLPHFRSFNRLS